MDFYTNVLSVGNNLLVRGYRNGKRFSERVSYAPKLFAPSKKVDSEWRSIDGQRLEMINLSSMREARDFLKRYEDVAGFAIHGLPRFEYVYLHEEFPGVVEYDRDLIRIVTIDIEVASADGFPDPDIASQEIVAITIKKDNEFVVFGCNGYQPKRKDVRYIRCDDERELLYVFLDEWERGTQPDIVTGWNVKFFDIPYLARRIASVLGSSSAKRLSPWNMMNERETVIKGKNTKYFDVEGVTILDYLEMYKKFTYSQQESYRLDHICSVEIGEKKLDYSEYETLHTLYLEDFEKFIDYNIRDVELVDKLDEKMKLIDMALTIAYDAKVNIDDVFTQVRMWDVIIHNHLWDRKIAVPAKGGGKKEGAYEGAYVKTPQVGGHDWVLSFDLNSLYPHLIMQYNISPEMLDRTRKANVSVDQMLGDSPMPLREGYALAPNGCYFRKDSQGFLPEIMERMYNDRVVYKNKMIAAQKNYEKATDTDSKKKYQKEISRYKNLQLAKKVQLNSAYGALGNQHFRFFNLDQATAITLGGQLSIRWAENKINEYLNTTLKTEGVDYVIASDTDSLYIGLSTLVDKVYGSPPRVEREKVVDFLDRSANEILEPVIDKIYSDLAERVGAFQQKMSMKREVIADRGIWTAKKRYILNVFDQEGVRFKEPKLKMMGIETVKSSTPASCRTALADALKIIMNKSEEELQEFIREFRTKFSSLPIEDVAFPRGVQGINKYSRADAKAIPIHVRGALAYNRKLVELKLDKKFEKIKEGEKIKFCYLKTPNPLHENVISIIHGMPKEFRLDQYIDYDTQFQKAFLEPLRAILDVIGWQDEKKSTLEDFFG
jgi:DNA polymerase elongation subunit (family B)